MCSPVYEREFFFNEFEELGELTRRVQVKRFAAYKSRRRQSNLQTNHYFLSSQLLRTDIISMIQHMNNNDYNQHTKSAML